MFTLHKISGEIGIDRQYCYDIWGNIHHDPRVGGFPLSIHVVKKYEEEPSTKLILHCGISGAEKILNQLGNVLVINPKLTHSTPLIPGSSIQEITFVLLLPTNTLGECKCAVDTIIERIDHTLGQI